MVTVKHREHTLLKILALHVSLLLAQRCITWTPLQRRTCCPEADTVVGRCLLQLRGLWGSASASGSCLVYSQALWAPRPRAEWEADKHLTCSAWCRPTLLTVPPLSSLPREAVSDSTRLHPLLCPILTPTFLSQVATQTIILHLYIIFVSAFGNPNLRWSLFSKMITVVLFLIFNFSDSLTEVYLGKGSNLEAYNPFFRNLVQETTPK